MPNAVDDLLSLLGPGFSAALRKFVYLFVDVARELGDFLVVTSTAVDEKDLDEAASHLAKAIAILGVAAFFALLAKVARGRGGNHGGGGKSGSGEGPPKATPAKAPASPKIGPSEPPAISQRPANPIAQTALSTAQKSALAKFNKKLPKEALTTEVQDLPNAGKVFKAEVPGKVPGSKAVYEKQIDATGQTVSYKKTTFAPDGNLVHIKTKYPEGQEITYGPGYKGTGK